jgi:uncharacterized protein YqeY
MEVAAMDSAFVQKLENDLKQSMRDKNEVKTSTLRMLISNIRYAVDRKRGDLFETESKKIPRPPGKEDDPAVVAYAAKLKELGAAIAAREIPFTDQDILGVIGKEIKQREDSISAYTAGKRQDLADKEAAEMAVLKSYMPQQMSADEVTAEAKKAISEMGAKGLGDKGRVMGKLIAQLKGKADGKAINDIVTQLLSSM